MFTSFIWHNDNQEPMTLAFLAGDAQTAMGKAKAAYVAAVMENSTYTQAEAEEAVQADIDDGTLSVWSVAVEMEG